VEAPYGQGARGLMGFWRNFWRAWVIVTTGVDPEHPSDGE